MLECKDQYLPALFLVLTFFSVMPVQGEEPYAIESFAAKASAQLPAEIVNAVEPQGSRLTTFVNGLKITVCELWWAKSVATQNSSPAAHGILYGGLRVGALVGVIHYLAESNEDYREDFLDQKLRPGYYTMRYAQMPEDREHKNVSPYRDFVLLSPVSVDRNPDRVLAVDEMLRWSRLASRSRHPAILSLMPVDTGHKNFPAVITDDAGSCILQAKLHLSQEKPGPPQDLGFAIILVTPLKENGES